LPEDLPGSAGHGPPADPELYRIWAVDDLERAHSMRFEAVANDYPRTVAQAYELDLAAAMAASDEDVAARVAAYEHDVLGIAPRDWAAIGRSEGKGER